MNTIDVTQELQKTENLEKEFKSIMLVGPSVRFYRHVLEGFKHRGRNDVSQAEFYAEIGRLIAKDVAEIIEEAEAE